MSMTLERFHSLRIVMYETKLKDVTILGASGSIGSSAVAFLRLHRDKFSLKNIAVKSDWRAALALCNEFGCTGVSIEDEGAARSFIGHSIAANVQLLHGPSGAAQLATDSVDVVLAAISGSEGLPSVLAALRSRNNVALANKEALVCGGPSLLALADSMSAKIIPVDSEHSAIYQSLLAGSHQEVESLLLTASGGPFRTATLGEMTQATPEAALNHPNWSMGVKNTIDSATLANKGLELIEAAYLFGCNEARIDVVINPSSVLHSAVCYQDGSMIAQLGRPDMRTAIGYGLSWPNRLPTGVEKLSLAKLRKLEFEEIDLNKFRPLSLARQALRMGGDGSLIFNAANELAVSAFVDGRIRLTDIATLIDICLERGIGRFCGSLDDIPLICEVAAEFCADQFARVSDSLLR
ncbi:1-deoxy-D-xylulose-5-phosphate reductoisomerase [Caballeronia sp. LZ043]|uniref:1-deoxy-D-xylulose-5-phosphate reductoisomerase n=1 Tax=Caballeronia sp. LZ043 TaxID=3038569 RepID=UPI00285B37BB|nr:1-deoxy-D-xylulose-5-phosphate reductoisomerase [Caballeronia sp. LZ043]MDR5826213.1 1-deoxy-D-xylulose-5-phosphate reductoisomerase [Caballeronia sp. LZ043]